MSKGVSAVGPGVARLAKSEAGRAVGKAAKKAITEGAIKVTEEIAKGEKPKQALKRSLESSSKDVARSVAKIARIQMKKDLENAKSQLPPKGRRKPRKKVQLKRRSIFD